MGNAVSFSPCYLSALLCLGAPVKCNSTIVTISSVHHDESRVTVASLVLSTWFAFSLYMICCWQASIWPSQNTQWSCLGVCDQMTWQSFPPPNLSESQCHLNLLVLLHKQETLDFLLPPFIVEVLVSLWAFRYAFDDLDSELYSECVSVCFCRLCLFGKDFAECAQAFKSHIHTSELLTAISVLPQGLYDNCWCGTGLLLCYPSLLFLLLTICFDYPSCPQGRSVTTKGFCLIG